MKRRRRILTVAGVLVALALVDFILSMSGDSGEPRIIGVWRFLITLLLAFFLARGKNSARWLTVMTTGFSAVGGFMFMAILLASREMPEGSGYLFVGVGVLTILYGAIAAFLAFSSGVTREIRRIAEQIQFPSSRKSRRRVSSSRASEAPDPGVR